MKRDTSLFIEDILESIKNIESFTKEITEKELSKNIEKQSAIIRQIEIIGEAAKNIPLSIRKKYPDIPSILIQCDLRMKPRNIRKAICYAKQNILDIIKYQEGGI